jgi:ubiquinone/menaquinone biosynthesis C-methylase UbiE
MTENKEEITSSPTDVPYGVKFIDPEKIIADLEIREGMKVADFGCGTGYFAIPLAKKVGKNGTVFAIDVIEQKLESVASQAKISGLLNVQTKRANLEKENGSGLENESVDWVIIVNMLFQNENKDVIIGEAKRVLRPKGKILIIEWDPNNSSIGPARDRKVTKNSIIEIVRKYLMTIPREIEVGNFSYGLLVSK